MNRFLSPARWTWLLSILVLGVALFSATARDGGERQAHPRGDHPEIQHFQRTGPLWTKTRSMTAEENALAHWKKHRREFPEYHSAQQYIERAHQFMNAPPEGTLTKTRPNGDTLFYHPESNTFAVRNKHGAPRTMFRPNSGMAYWNRQ